MIPYGIVPGFLDANIDKAGDIKEEELR